MSKHVLNAFQYISGSMIAKCERALWFTLTFLLANSFLILSGKDKAHGADQASIAKFLKDYAGSLDHLKSLADNQYVAGSSIERRYRLDPASNESISNIIETLPFKETINNYEYNSYLSNKKLRVFYTSPTFFDRIVAKNGTEEFVVEKVTPSSQYSLEFREWGSVFSNLVHSFEEQTVSATYSVMGYSIGDTLLSKSTSVKEIVEIDNNGHNLIKVVFEYQKEVEGTPTKELSRTESLTKMNGWCMFDKNLFHAIVKFAISSESSIQSGALFSVSGDNTYANSTGAPVLTSQQFTDLYSGKSKKVKGLQTYRFDVKQWEYGAGNNTIFSLDAYGLNTIKPMPRTWLSDFPFWILGISICCLVAGIYLKNLAGRRSRPSAGT